MNLSAAELAAQTPSTDGRVLRGAKTRTAIVEALFELFKQGIYTPTTKQIAEQAQTSVRSIFQHFEDMETLYADLLAVQTVRITPLMESLSADGTLEQRLTELQAQRGQLYELVSPARHALATRPNISKLITQGLSDLSAELRGQLLSQFAAELSVASTQSAADSVEWLDLLWSFESWDRLRNIQHLSVEEAGRSLCAATLRVLP
ncbi:transcriptional regulator, TetR family [Actinobacteria bacterium IMCC26207]|nr:transcriptional regulator, TetR family [Actinobacteria bacterium IMCC26207]